MNSQAVEEQQPSLLIRNGYDLFETFCIRSECKSDAEVLEDLKPLTTEKLWLWLKKKISTRTKENKK